MGIGEVVGEIAEKSFGDKLGSFMGRFTEGQGMFKTARDIMEKSEPTKILLDHLDNVVIPQSRKSSQAYFDAGVKALPKNMPNATRVKVLGTLAEEARAKGWGDAKSAYLGKHDEVLIKTIHDATKQKGEVYGNMISDALTYVLHDAGEAKKIEGKDAIAPGWRTRRVLKDVRGEGGISLQDVGIRERSRFTAPEEWEKALRETSGWLNAPLIVIPHVGQTAAILLTRGFGATAKALADYGKIIGGADDIMGGILKSGVLWDEMNIDMQRQAKGLGMFEKLFHFPGFSWVRKQELMISALAGKHALIDVLGEMQSEGVNKWNTNTLNKLGFQVDEMAEKGFKATQEDIERAMFREANRSIQITRELDTPWKWNESAMARMGFQYKHFAYQFGRMLSTTLRESWKYGGPKQGLKTLGILGFLFPAVGEMVHSAENIAQFKDPSQRDMEGHWYEPGTPEWFDAMGHVGGIGIFYSLWRSGLYYKGRGFLEGPVIGNIFQTGGTLAYHGYKAAKDLEEGDYYKAKREGKTAAKDVLFKLGWPGRLAAEQIKENLEETK